MAAVPTISSVTEDLASLKAGSRAWFWLCPQMQDPHPPLLLKSFKKDAQMKALKAEVAALPVPEGATLCLGFASVGKSGQLQFGSQAMSWEIFEALAVWATRHVDEHPDLSRLKNAACLNISSQGVVVKKFESEGAWESMPDPVVPGTIAETVHNLGRLRPGRDFWFYMSAGGTAGAPFLVLGSSKRDPDAARFAKKVSEVRRRFPEPDSTARGVLRQLPSGGLAFTTNGHVAEAATILNQLLEHYPEELGSLQTARVIGLVDGKFAQTATAADAAAAGASKLDLSALEGALGGLGEGSSALFWFTEAAENDAALLVIATDKDELKAAAAAAGGDGARGKVVVSKKGWLEFRVRKPAPGFIDALAAFAVANHGDWPALRRLSGARMTQRSSTGDILDRQKNDDAWSALG